MPDTNAGPMPPKELAERLLEVTKEGPCSQWVDRISVVAKDAGLRAEMIDWGGSPALVAWAVVSHAISRGTLATELLACKLTARGHLIAKEKGKV